MNKPKKILFLILLCLVIGLTATQCRSTTKPDDPEAILEKQPFADLTDSIREFPNQAGLYFRRAELLSKNNIHDIALLDFKKSWELAPNEITGMRYASDLSIAGRPVDALRLLQDASNRFPANREFKRLLGEALVQAGRISEVLELYHSMLNKDSSDFEAWYELGLLDEQLRDTASAIHSLEKAYAIQPVDTYALELAHLYAECKNPAAITLCDEIIRHDSSREWIDPFFIKGIYYSNKLQFAFAIIQFDSCIRRDWKFTDAYIEKGIAQFKLKNFGKALTTFTLAATVSNTSADAYYWAGRCYEAIDKKDEAILNYEKAIALDRNFTEAQEALNRVKS